MLAEVKGKNYEKSETETRILSNGTIKKTNILRKERRDMTNKHELKMKQLQKYKTMDTAKKRNLLNKKAEQYKTMVTAKKQDLLKKAEYKTMVLQNKIC